MRALLSAETFGPFRSFGRWKVQHRLAWSGLYFSSNLQGFFHMNRHDTTPRLNGVHKYLHAQIPVL